MATPLVEVDGEDDPSAITCTPMNGNSILSVGLALLVVGSLGGVGLAAASHASAADATVHRSSAPPNAGSSNGGQVGTGTPNGTAGANTTGGPFDLSVENITSCGETCRVITATLTNQGNDTAENVTVTSTVLAGDTVITERRTQVDNLSPNETVTRTIRVSVSLDDVRAIQQNDGRITIRTVVTSEQHNETFVANRTVL